MEQRVMFYGGKFAQESAEEVLKEAKKIIDENTNGTGHLSESGIVRKVAAGQTASGSYEGGGASTGSSFTNKSHKTAYVISFNTMRIYKMKVFSKEVIGTKLLKVNRKRTIRVKQYARWNKRVNSSSVLETVTRESERSRTAVAHERGRQSLQRAFNYAVIVHEGDAHRVGLKFLERAYQLKKTELAEKFKKEMREAFNIRYTSSGFSKRGS